MITVTTRRRSSSRYPNTRARDAKGAATALFVTADNKVEQRTIGVRRTIGESWLVDSGVSDGDSILSRATVPPSSGSNGLTLSVQT